MIKVNVRLGTLAKMREKVQQVKARAAAVPVVGIGVTEETGAQAYDDRGKSLIDIAYIQEYGDGHTPQRSFVRAWADEAKASALSKLKKATYAQVIKNMQGSIEQVAKTLRDSMIDRIWKRIPPSNAPRTQEKKGFDHPLIHTLKLVGAISYILRRRGRR